MRESYIPTVHELEAFSACAQLGTTTLAAQHLNLTQSAVSRSIASLEGRLGVALFHRVRKRLVLSAAGQDFAPQAAQLLSNLQDAAMGVMAFGGHDATLRIAVLPTLARNWLIPKLSTFAQEHPEITFDITARLGAVNFDEGRCDLAIMRSTHQPPDSHFNPLFDEELIVVASPTLMEARPALTDADLMSLPLLQQSTRPTLWLDWFKSGEVDPRQILRGARLDHFDMVMDMAAGGLGVGLVPEVLAAPVIRAGNLVKAAHRRFTTGDAYGIITPEHSPERPYVTTFCNWLANQA